MNRHEAKIVLAGWRPSLPGEPDPLVVEALALARKDPELGAWLERQTEFHSAVQRGLRSIAVPDDLAQRVLAGRKIARATFRLRVVRWVAAAAALALLAVLTAVWLRPTPVDSLATFRSRMVRAALREYPMDVVTNGMPAIRAFMAKNHAPADYELTPALASLKPVGGGLLAWQNQRVAMVCLDGGADGMLFLFVVDSALAPGRPPRNEALAMVNKLATASWTRGP